jgi:hypothetical protein
MVRPADDTFETKTDAEVWLTRKEAEILEDDWIDPDAGEVLLPDYSATWIDERPGLRPKTVTLYRYLLRSYIAPYFPAAVTPSGLPNRAPAVVSISFPDLIVPDLRKHLDELDGCGSRLHQPGRQTANPRELMERMGHDSARVALIDLHSSAERQRALANEIGKKAKAALGESEGKPKHSGTRKARNESKTS